MATKNITPERKAQLESIIDEWEEEDFPEDFETRPLNEDGTPGPLKALIRFDERFPLGGETYRIILKEDGADGAEQHKVSLVNGVTLLL